MEGPAISLRSVSKWYGDHVVLNDVVLDVEAGEFVVLLGPSGCGKSTLLKLIAGLEDVTDGEVYIKGELVNYVVPKDRDVAMVFQDYALYPHMTVERNIEFPLRMRRLPRGARREKVVEVARLLSLDDMLAKLPEQLSGGQRQRVALGRAIVRDPVAFLMDEPLSNLDAMLRAQMREELLQLHRRVRRTIIYVTHDQIEAMTMADRIVVLNAGVIQQVGSPTEIYERPSNVFVASFVGAPQINLVAGEVSAEGAFSAGGVELAGDVGRQGPPPGPCTVGVRPEDVRLGSLADGSLSARVDLVEPAGHEKYVRARIGPELTMVARAGRSEAIDEGADLGLTIDWARCHWFGADGERLGPVRA